MPNFAANLTMLFQENDFLDRFKAAAEAGFRGVEYLFPYGTWQTSATSSSPTTPGGTNRVRVR